MNGIKRVISIIRLILCYYSALLPLNLALSFMAGFLTVLVNSGEGAPEVFFLTFVLPGIACSTWFHDRFHPGEWYFYLNSRISRQQLIVGAWTVNAILALVGILLFSAAQFVTGG